MHALLEVGERETLLSHPVPGASWEGMAIEITRSSSPTTEQGFHAAREIVRPERSVMVYSGVDRFPLGDNVEAVPLTDLVTEIAKA